jgi:trehalose 6-phosphate synthase
LTRLHTFFRSLRLQLKFIVPLVLVLLIAAILCIPLIDSLTSRWVSRDIVMRASVISTALSDSITEALLVNRPEQLNALFTRTLRDEKLMAMAVCSRDDVMLQRTDEFPPTLDCHEAETIAEHDARIILKQGVIHVAVRPIDAGKGVSANLVLLHDMGFIERRSHTIRNYLVLIFTALGAVICGTTMLVAHLSWRGWVSGVKSILQGEGLLEARHLPAPELAPLQGDLRKMLRQLEDEHRRAHAVGDEWDATRLRAMLKSDLRDEHLIVVSNREPYVHEKHGTQTTLVRPASGLVTALEPIMRACSGTWIAHGSGSADREQVDSHDRLLVPEGQPSYTLRRLWLTKADEVGYYYGFANEGLWPLCHIAHVRPVFRQSDWECYKRVNRMFADAVVAEARSEDPLVLVQDYHLALAPRMIRERLPNATIISFWHIPWPNPESFGICPWREELLHGMLGSTILGFHTRFHCKNFMETVDRYLETRIEQEHSTISFLGQQTLVESYPISIHWPSEAERAAWPSFADCRAALRQKLGVGPDHLIALGLDRFDYTKGIFERMLAVERLLEKHPDLVGRFTLVQIAAPTRDKLSEYQAFRNRLEALAAQINRRFTQGNYQPIHLIVEHQESNQVTNFYRATDICLVTSIHDGMNLVCKEFIAARDDEHGVLILSQFAGASRELSEALQINPYHTEETADTLYAAINMPRVEQRERMQSLRSTVREKNVYGWAGAMLADAARLRLRGRVHARLQAHRKDAR